MRAASALLLSMVACTFGISDFVVPTVGKNRASVYC